MTKITISIFVLIFSIPSTIKAQNSLDDLYKYLVVTGVNDRIHSIQYDSLKHDLFYFISIDDFQHVQLIKMIDRSSKGILINSVWRMYSNEEIQERNLRYIEIPEEISSDLISFLASIEGDSLSFCSKGLKGKTISILTRNKNGVFKKDYYAKDNSCNETNNSQPQKNNITMFYRKLSNQLNMDSSFEKFKETLPGGAYMYQSTRFIIF